MEKIVRGLTRILAILAAASIIVMVVAIAADVVVRNSTGGSLPGMIETAETSLVVSVFFGLAWAGVNGEHVAVTLLTDRFNKIWTRVVNIFIWALSSLFIAWLIYASTLRAMDSTRMLEERFGLVRWPVYPMRWVLVIGLVALLLVAILNLARTLRGRTPMGPADEVEAALTQDETAAMQSDESVPDSAETAGRHSAVPTAQTERGKI